MWDPYAEFESAVLPNGLTVYASHWPDRPWETISFLVHTGASSDPVGLEGVAHFVEHMVSKNTVVPYDDIRSFFEVCGGYASLGTTGYPYTTYEFFVPTDATILSQALNIFGNMLFQAMLEQFLERERSVITGEFRQSYPAQLPLDLQ